MVQEENRQVEKQEESIPIESKEVVQEDVEMREQSDHGKVSPVYQRRHHEYRRPTSEVEEIPPTSHIKEAQQNDIDMLLGTSNDHSHNKMKDEKLLFDDITPPQRTSPKKMKYEQPEYKIEQIRQNVPSFNRIKEKPEPYDSRRNQQPTRIEERMRSPEKERQRLQTHSP